MTAPPTPRRRLVHGVVVLTALLVEACGGGGGGTTPPPPDTTPASITLSASGNVTLTSGNTVTVTATVLTRSGAPVQGAQVTWTSSNPQVATVQNGLITGVLVGNTAVTASVGSVTSAPLTVTTTPGAPTRLGVRTQPNGASVGAPIATQPVVEVRDAAGNVVTTSSVPVTVALASGDGVLAGTTNVTAASGVATFTDLVLTGTVGPRTLSFTSIGLTATSSIAFALAPGVPARMVVVRQPLGGAVGAQLLTQPIVELRDVSNNVSTGSTAQVAAGLTGFTGTVAGTVSVAAVAGVATFTNLVVNGQPGTYTLAFSSPGLPGAAANATPLPAIIFGFPDQKVQILDAGGSATAGLSSGSAASYGSRAPSRVTIDNAGRFAAVAEGQAWLVATNSLGRDSLLTVVTRSAGGPVLRTNLPTYVLGVGDTTTIDVVLDPRATPIGALTAILVLNTQDFSPVYQIQSLNVAGAQVTANATNPNVFRFSVATTTPIAAPVTIARLRLVSGPRDAQLRLTADVIDITAPDGADLLSRATSTIYPLVFR